MMEILIQLSELTKIQFPKNSIIEYSVDNGQTWYILNPNDNIPTVSTVRKQKILKFLYGYPIPINDDTWTSQEYKAIISRATPTPNFPSP